MAEQAKSDAGSRSAGQCLHDTFAGQARRRGNSVAVVQGERSLTYAELHERARALADRLRAEGVGPDVVVGLFAERSIEMLIGMIGILEAGGAYLPLRVDDPADRLSFILRDAGVRVVVTTPVTDERGLDFDGARVRADAPGAGIPAAQSPARASEENLAYVIYTSGTTGTPKGVAVPHRAAARIVRTGIYGDFDEHQTFLQACPLSFDASVFEIWAALANGARLVLLPQQRSSADAVIDTVRRHGVTTCWLTPTLFNQLVDEGRLKNSGLRQVVVGGEVVSTPHLAQAMRSTDIRFANGYGPTEAGVFTCCHIFRAADLAYAPPPVGAPLPGTRVWILDERMRPVPDGELGEVYIGGPALAREYHRRPDLTERAFLPDPFGETADGRIYRSGDLARMLPGGLVQVVGRVDSQVKIRGNRVELTEVEAALLDEPSVAQAAVVDRGEGAERVLAAYVIPAYGAEPTVAELRARLATRLPDYMIPAEFHRLEQLPLTRHGKTDRAALRAETDAPRLELGTAYRPPAGELETLIAAIWAEVLRVQAVGMDDNYFDLGGTSLSIKQAQLRLEERTGVRLPSTALYEYPTVRALAEAMAKHEV
ncbi:non-ribosomal peptide synthetase [Streptomyces sp. HUAS TT20]|uniref:non-ribosomal peptide synthetase n=1 Tax=Streptomyces sp. HUAS TT20 TaxID=3447509 RepID=UPI0021D8D95C|nr:non-ribosomal peptide synthetase [Streptomyces sp. HUAS 15-9]UXY30491.1 non-ribosomal peptide synthetase [Streptomyces sp. HUAS 15-9]